MGGGGGGGLGSIGWLRSRVQVGVESMFVGEQEIGATHLSNYEHRSLVMKILG